MTKTQYFAFAPVLGLNTDRPFPAEASPRVFQVSGGEHRCRLSLKYPVDFPEVDRSVHAGGIEVIESYRSDPRWREITDEARIAEIAAEVNWGPMRQ